MKIYGKLFALCAISPVSAFVAHGPKFSRQTSLNSQNYIENLSSSATESDTYKNLRSIAGADDANIVRADEESVVSTDDGSMVQANEGSMDAMEARLDSLEQGQGIMDDASSGKMYSNKGQQIWDSASKVKCQGGSLKTFTFPNPLVERVQVVLKTDGRPLNADVDLWNGPDNTPVKMRVYLEDGSERPFMTSIETPRGPNTVAIRNTAHLEFPLDAAVAASVDGQDPLESPRAPDITIQGGALKTFPFDTLVQSVQVLLKTDGRPLNSRIELLQGPNNNKQVVEIYTEDGIDRPFFMVIETPGSGNVVRILNTAPVEFPMTASVEPYLIGVDETAAFEPVIGGDQDW